MADVTNLKRDPEFIRLRELDPKAADQLLTELSVEGSRKPGSSEGFINRALKFRKRVTEPARQFSIGFANEAAFGLPEVGLKKIGVDLPEPETVSGQVGRVAGQVGGFAFGGPMKVVGKGAVRLAGLAPRTVKTIGGKTVTPTRTLGKRTAGEPLRRKALRSGVESAAAAASITPAKLARGDEPSEAIFNVATETGMGLAAPSIVSGAKKIGGVFKATKPVRKPPGSIESARSIKSGELETRRSIFKQLRAKRKDLMEQEIVRRKDINVDLAKVKTQERVGDLKRIQKVTDSELSSEAYRESKRIREDLFTLFKNKTDEYGKELGDLLTSDKVDALVDPEDLLEILDDSLSKRSLEFLEDVSEGFKPLGPKTKQILAIRNRIANSIEDGNVDPVDLRRVMNLETSLKRGTRFGKAFTPDDSAANMIRQDITELIEDRVPGLRSLREKYKEFYKFKGESIERFGHPSKKTFRSLVPSQKFLAKIGVSDEVAVAVESDREFLNLLNKQIGRNVSQRVSQLGGASAQVGREIEFSQEMSKVVIDELNRVAKSESRDLANIMKLRNIKSDRYFAELKLKNQRLLERLTVLGIGSSAAIYYIYRKAIKGADEIITGGSDDGLS